MRDKICLWNERLDIVKMWVVSKLLYNFNAIQTKILIGFLHMDLYVDSKMYVEIQRIYNGENILEKENYKTYYKLK